METPISGISMIIWAIFAIVFFIALQTLRLEKIMAADKAALDAKIDELAARLANVVADLQKIIDAGGTPADFQPEVDKLQAMVDALNTADPDPTN